MAFLRKDMTDDYFDQDKIPRIDPDVLRKLSKLRPWRSFAAIISDWLIIVACIVVCVKISYWFYPLAFVIVGTRFHALEAMMHEATHYRLHPNKTVNEVIGELSVWPIGLSVFVYRYVRHFSHHRNIGTVKDAHVFQYYVKYPERFAVPLSARQLVRRCMLVAVTSPRDLWLDQIYGSAKMLLSFSKQRAALWIGFQVALVACIFAGSFASGMQVALIYFLFFVLPVAWVAVFSRYLRLLAEHFGIPDAQQTIVPGGGTRTTIVNWPVRIMLWPHNLNYHLEHHWYPSVPFYNLPTLHKILYESPHIREKMHVTKGLKQLFRELTVSA